ncbi:MAG: hypothetical protein HOY71_21220, partial [Nonomuraea sp.]|nr:hypothetical protein [Nonomuraea sp.]
GLAWLFGFGALVLAYGFDGRGLVSWGWPVGLTVLMSLQLVAMILMIVTLHRSTGSIRGESARRWAMWGWTWPAGFFAVGMFDMWLAKRLADDQMTQISCALAMLIVGLLYMTGGALGREWPMFALGVWILAVDAVSLQFAPGVQLLLLAVLAGLGAIATGCWMRWRA